MGRKFVFWFLSCILIVVWSYGAKNNYSWLLAGTEVLSGDATYGAELVLEQEENSPW